jgi:hypothetical protein
VLRTYMTSYAWSSSMSCCQILNHLGVAHSCRSQEPTLPALRHNTPQHDRDDRGDVLFVMPNALVVGDVLVTHPAANTNVVAAAREPGAAAARRDREKHRQYGEAQDYDFAPLVVETYGRLGRPAMAMLNALADVAAANGGVSKAVFVRGALRERAGYRAEPGQRLDVLREHVSVGTDGRARLSARAASSYRGCGT